MIDIVVPLGGKCIWQQNELRYCLRAIEKYLTGYRDIYIIGTRVKWLTGVKYLPFVENYTEKQRSIFQKLLTAANTPEISDPFLMFNDDHFLLKPLDVKDIKYWKHGTIKDLIAKSLGTYQRTVANSYKYLVDKGWGQDNFDIHVPILYEKEKFKQLAGEDWSKEHIIKSLYCNKHSIKGEEMKDLVIRKPMRREEIRQAIEGRLFFSINEAGTNEAMKTVLGELWPDPSKYELILKQTP